MNEDEIEKYRLAVATCFRAWENFVRAWIDADKIEDEELQIKKKTELSLIFELIYEPLFLKLKLFYEEHLEARGDEPDTFWSNQYQFLENGDMKAARRLKSWFPRRAIFWHDQWKKLEPIFFERVGDDQAEQSNWDQLLSSALFLAWDKMELENLYRENNPVTSIKSIKDEKRSDAYHSLIKDARITIEHDLLDGATLDSIQPINLDEISPKGEKENRVKANELDLISKWDTEIDLQAALSQLSNKEKQIIEDRVNGSTYEEIASGLGINPAAARMMHERAIKKARKKLLEYLTVVSPKKAIGP